MNHRSALTTMVGPSRISRPSCRKAETNPFGIIQLAAMTLGGATS